MSRELLIDKYRPSTLQSLNFNKSANLFLSEIAKKQNIPHLIIEGARGSGKKLRTQLFLKEKYGIFPTFAKTLNLDLLGKETKQVNVLCSKYHYQLNPSIHNIYDRTLMQCFTNEIIHTRMVLDIPYRIIVIEDADLLSIDAQESLRRTLETCVRTCRFIFLANNEAKIIAPLYSRCITVKIASPTVDEMLDIMSNITISENVNIPHDTLRDIAVASKRNIQTALHFLNKLILINATVFEQSEHDHVYRYCVQIIDTIIKGHTITGIMDKVRLLVYELVNYCVECKTIIPILLDITMNKLPTNAHVEKLELCTIAVKRDESIRTSSKDIYHIESLCLHIMQILKSSMMEKQRITPRIKNK